MGPVLILIASLLTASPTLLGAPERVGPVEVELVSEHTAVVPGEPFKLGLRILPDDDWHVYWKNPGDAGLPPTLKWSLPEGFAASDILYPAPDLIPAGPLAAYGYHGEALYAVTMTPPAGLTVGDTVEIAVKADWLVCREECLPGSARLELRLPVVEKNSAKASEWSGLFAQAHRDTPIPLPKNWRAAATLNEEEIELHIEPPVALTERTQLSFFAADKGVIEYSAPQRQRRHDDVHILELTKSPYSTADPVRIRGVLSLTENDQTSYYDIDVPVDAAQTAPVAAAATDVSFPFALALAFLGGMILNLMPCVLPVLSLKVLGLVEQAGQSRKALFSHGLIFSLGIVVTFWALVLVMFGLQAGGAELGWGFQLQSPGFVLVMAGFIFLMALNMFGLYEISFLTPAGSRLSGHNRGGLGSAFLSGITATLLATPCTAPFMGTALGYSLTQPPLVSLMIYTSLGVGMAAPYLALTMFPSLLRFVPKPGRWMETLKHALGFLLIATVIWLAWVLSYQADAPALVVLHGVLLLLAVAAWIYGRWSLASRRSSAVISRVVSLAILVIALAGGSIAVGSSAANGQSETDGEITDARWRKFTPQTLDSLRTLGEPVFVDFTAAWCLSCQVNERVALSTDDIHDRFNNLNVTLLKADWTRRSPEITAALAQFGRNSVPLYVLYGPGGSEPQVLPEILTTGIVHEALDRIDPKKSTR